MRHLAVRHQAAEPALRACLMVSVLGAAVLLAAAPVRGGTQRGAWWQLGSGPSMEAERGDLAVTSTGPYLSEEIFSESVYQGRPDGWPLQESSAEPARYMESGWLGDSSSSPHEQMWRRQILPDGLIYRSYLASVKESRFASQWVHDVNLGWMWDITLGGRVGLLRYGTTNADHPEGWQIDMEGAGMPRLDLEHDRDVMASDFRFGIPITYGRRSYQTKLAYYHLSSHLGDEYMVRHQTLQRRNYSRDVIVWGHSYFLTEDIRLYGEAGWAFVYDGGTEPWEFQVGVDYSPIKRTGQQGSPFVAINGHLRQEFDFGGNIVFQAGWQWRGHSGHLFRVGLHYFQGMSDQWEFFDQFEDKLGFGVWYDF